MTLVHSGASASIPTCAVVLLAALLVGCVPIEEEALPAAPTEPAPSAESVTKRRTVYYDQTGDRIWVACHNGRLLYVFDGYKAGGLDVIDAAPECMEATTANSVGTKASAEVNQNDQVIP